MALKGSNQLKALGLYTLWASELAPRIPPQGLCGFKRQKPQPPVGVAESWDPGMSQTFRTQREPSYASYSS
jgi:hypothetical protein